MLGPAFASRQAAESAVKRELAAIAPASLPLAGYVAELKRDKSVKELWQIKPRARASNPVGEIAISLAGHASSPQRLDSSKQAIVVSKFPDNLWPEAEALQQAYSWDEGPGLFVELPPGSHEELPHGSLPDSDRTWWYVAPGKIAKVMGKQVGAFMKKRSSKTREAFLTELAELASLTRAEAVTAARGVEDSPAVKAELEAAKEKRSEAAKLRARKRESQKESVKREATEIGASEAVRDTKLAVKRHEKTIAASRRTLKEARAAKRTATPAERKELDKTVREHKDLVAANTRELKRFKQRLQLALRLEENCPPAAKAAPCPPGGRDAAPPKRTKLENGTPIVRGSQTLIFYPGPSGPESLKGYYGLIKASELVPSHDPVTFAPDKRYDQSLQERDYAGDKNEQHKVLRQARAFKPELVLNSNPDAVNGPPIIDQQGQVLGGNSRAMTILRVLADTPAIYEKALARELADHCEEFGLEGASAAEMKGHVLVRVLTGDRYSSRDISTLFNRALMQTIARETGAVSVGKMIPSSVYMQLAHRLDAGDTLSQAIGKDSASIIEALQKANVITPQNKAEWLVPGGGVKLSAEGVQRLKAGIVGAVIGDRTLATRIAQMPSLANFIERIAPVAMVIDTWDGDNKTGYNWIIALRKALCEAPSVGNKRLGVAGGFEDHYGTTGMFAPSCPQIFNAADPLPAVVLRWLVEAKGTPAKFGKAVFAYWRQIPGEIKHPEQPMLMPRSVADIKRDKSDPDGLRVRLLHMASVDEVRRAGGPQRWLAGEPPAPQAPAELELELGAPEPPAPKVRDLAPLRPTPPEFQEVIDQEEDEIEIVPGAVYYMPSLPVLGGRTTHALYEQTTKRTLVKGKPVMDTLIWVPKLGAGRRESTHKSRLAIDDEDVAYGRFVRYALPTRFGAIKDIPPLPDYHYVSLPTPTPSWEVFKGDKSEGKVAFEPKWVVLSGPRITASVAMFPDLDPVWEAVNFSPSRELALSAEYEGIEDERYRRTSREKRDTTFVLPMPERRGAELGAAPAVKGWDQYTPAEKLRAKIKHQQSERDGIRYRKDLEGPGAAGMELEAELAEVDQDISDMEAQLDAIEYPKQQQAPAPTLDLFAPAPLAELELEPDTGSHYVHDPMDRQHVSDQEMEALEQAQQQQGPEDDDLERWVPPADMDPFDIEDLVRQAKPVYAEHVPLKFGENEADLKWRLLVFGKAAGPELDELPSWTVIIAPSKGGQVWKLAEPVATTFEAAQSLKASMIGPPAVVVEVRLSMASLAWDEAQQASRKERSEVAEAAKTAAAWDAEAAAAAAKAAEAQATLAARFAQWPQPAKFQWLRDEGFLFEPGTVYEIPDDKGAFGSDWYLLVSEARRNEEGQILATVETWGPGGEGETRAMGGGRGSVLQSLQAKAMRTRFASRREYEAAHDPGRALFPEPTPVVSLAEVRARKAAELAPLAPAVQEPHTEARKAARPAWPGEAPALPVLTNPLEQAARDSYFKGQSVYLIKPHHRNDGSEATAELVELIGFQYGKNKQIEAKFKVWHPAEESSPGADSRERALRVGGGELREWQHAALELDWLELDDLPPVPDLRARRLKDGNWQVLSDDKPAYIAMASEPRWVTLGIPVSGRRGWEVYRAFSDRAKGQASLETLGRGQALLVFLGKALPPEKALAELAPGMIVTIGKRSKKRYLVIRQDQFGKFDLQALSGGMRGSAPDSMRRDQLHIADDQQIEFSGAKAGERSSRAALAVNSATLHLVGDARSMDPHEYPERLRRTTASPSGKPIITWRRLSSAGRDRLRADQGPATPAEQAELAATLSTWEAEGTMGMIAPEVAPVPTPATIPPGLAFWLPDHRGPIGPRVSHSELVTRATDISNRSTVKELGERMLNLAKRALKMPQNTTDQRDKRRIVRETIALTKTGYDTLFFNWITGSENEFRAALHAINKLSRGRRANSVPNQLFNLVRLLHKAAGPGRRIGVEAPRPEGVDNTDNFLAEWGQLDPPIQRMATALWYGFRVIPRSMAGYGGTEESVGASRGMLTVAELHGGEIRLTAKGTAVMLVLGPVATWNAEAKHRGYVPTVRNKVVLADGLVAWRVNDRYYTLPDGGVRFTLDELGAVEHRRLLDLFSLFAESDAGHLSTKQQLRVREAADSITRHDPRRAQGWKAFDILADELTPRRATPAPAVPAAIHTSPPGNSRALARALIARRARGEDPFAEAQNLAQVIVPGVRSQESWEVVANFAAWGPGPKMWKYKSSLIREGRVRVARQQQAPASVAELAPAPVAQVEVIQQEIAPVKQQEINPVEARQILTLFKEGLSEIWQQ